MLDLLKDVMESWLSRIRNPISSSIILVFLVLNWKSIWYLLFAEQDVAVKFRFFDMNTSIVSLLIGPIAYGVALAVVTPWVKLAGVWISVSPTRALRQLYSDQSYHERSYELLKETELENAKAKAEAARERRIIEAAQRLAEARKIDGSDAADDIINERTEETVKNKNPVEIYEMLSTREAVVLSVLGGLASSVNTSNASTNIYFIDSLNKLIGNLNEIRLKVELDASLELLSKEGLTQKDRNGSWMLTELGYKVYDVLEQV